MKRIVLTIAILLGVSVTYAQSSKTAPASNQEHIAATVNYEMAKLKSYNLTATQEKALIKANQQSVEAMHTLGPSSADANAFKKIRETKEAEYKKVLTKEQYEKWMSDPNK